MEKTETLVPFQTRAITITDICWDTDGEHISLPTAMVIPRHEVGDDVDSVSEYLERHTGWLVMSYRRNGTVHTDEWVIWRRVARMIVQRLTADAPAAQIRADLKGQFVLTALLSLSAPQRKHREDAMWSDVIALVKPRRFDPLGSIAVVLWVQYGGIATCNQEYK